MTETVFGLPRALIRNILLLSLCSGLQISTVSITITISSLIGQYYATQAWMMTFPIAAVLFGMVIMTYPASAIVTRFGRKKAFILGSCTAFIGTGIIALMMLWAFWWGIIFGYFIVGLGLSAGAFYIYAANDGAEAQYSGRISGIILLGGLLAALIGPNAARLAQRIDTDTPLLAVPIMMAVFCLLVLLMLIALKKSSSEMAVDEKKLDFSGLKRVVSSVYFWSAALISASGYGAMTLTMNATTPWMFDHGMMMDHTSSVISLHLLGMFAPAPLSGWIADKFGSTWCSFLGFVMFIACFVVLLFGREYIHFIVALILLGIGWSMTMVAGTKKIVALSKYGDKSASEASSALLIALANIFSAFTAGAIYIGLGWQGVLIISAAFILLGLMALLLGLIYPLPLKTE